MVSGGLDAGDASGQGASEAELFRLMAETASDIVYAVAPDRLVTWVSPSITRGFGWRPEEIVGTRMSDLVHPEDFAASEERRARLYAGDRAAEAEGSFIVRMRRTDGEYRWVKTTLTTHRDGDRVTGFTGGMMIVDDLVEARAQLAAQEALLRLQFDAQMDPQALMTPIHDATGEVVDYRHVRVNRALCEYYGRSEEEILELTLTELEPGAVRTGLLAMYILCAASDEAVVLDGFHYVDTWTGEDEYFDIRMVPVPGGAISLSWRDVTERIDGQALLERKATYDDLTGALKRDAVLRRATDRVLDERDPGGCAALLFIDIDGFKTINDTHGHGSGDALLQELAARMRGWVREHDAVGRLGGDEFLIVLDGVHGSDEALAIAEGLRRECARPIALPDAEVVTTLSIGLAMLQAGDDVDTWVMRADRAMYEAKRNGRDRVVVA